MKDEELIEILIEGKEGAAEALMNQYGAMIHYIINPIVVNTQDREECYSDVILRVLDKVEQFTGSPARFKGWLTTLTRNVAINKVRGKRIEQESEETLKKYSVEGTNARGKFVENGIAERDQSYFEQFAKTSGTGVGLSKIFL